MAAEADPLFREVESPVPGAAAFVGTSPRTNGLTCIVDTLEIDGKQWRHLSVSRRSRTPSHDDLMVASAAFLDRECVTLAIYPRHTEWRNFHPHCLHLWQPLGFDPVPDPKLERADSVGPPTRR